MCEHYRKYSCISIYIYMKLDTQYTYIYIYIDINIICIHRDIMMIPRIQPPRFSNSSCAMPNKRCSSSRPCPGGGYRCYGDRGWWRARFATENGDFTKKNGGFKVESVDFTVENCDFTVKKGDFLRWNMVIFA